MEPYAGMTLCDVLCAYLFIDLARLLKCRRIVLAQIAPFLIRLIWADKTGAGRRHGQAEIFDDLEAIPLRQGKIKEREAAIPRPTGVLFVRLVAVAFVQRIADPRRGAVNAVLLFQVAPHDTLLPFGGAKRAQLARCGINRDQQFALM